MSGSHGAQENNYTTVDRGLTATVWGIKYFIPYLCGRRFKVMDNHKPLTWIISVKKTDSRLTWWIQPKGDYDTVYKPGVQNTNANMLFRIGVLN